MSRNMENIKWSWLFGVSQVTDIQQLISHDKFRILSIQMLTLGNSQLNVRTYLGIQWCGTQHKPVRLIVQSG